MRSKIKTSLMTLLPFLAEPAIAHPGHGIEYSLTTLVVLVVFVVLLTSLYRKP